MRNRWLTTGLFALIASLGLLAGCEKVSNSAKNIQSDWIGLDRKIEIYSCHTGKLIKSIQGSVRINPDDNLGQTQTTSFLVNGKKLHTNMCFVVTEIGIKEQPVTP